MFLLNVKVLFCSRCKNNVSFSFRMLERFQIFSCVLKLLCIFVEGLYNCSFVLLLTSSCVIMDWGSDEDMVGYCSETTLCDISIYFHQFCFSSVCVLCILDALLSWCFCIRSRIPNTSSRQFLNGICRDNFAHVQYISTFLLEGAVCSYPCGL